MAVVLTIIKPTIAKRTASSAPDFFIIIPDLARNISMAQRLELQIKSDRATPSVKGKIRKNEFPGERNSVREKRSALR